LAKRLKENLMIFGYARVSKGDGQTTVAQKSELTKAGCERVLEEVMSGGRWDRPVLQKLLTNQLRPGDVLIVWKLDRLSRSLKDMLNILETVNKAGSGFRSLTEGVDTTTPAGTMVMHMLGAFAQYERSMVSERTRMGLRAAREAGRIGGRRPKLPKLQRAEAVQMVQSGSKTISEVARLFETHPSTIYRLVAESRVEGVIA
jgi:DNA invertase Pin-like site-specific DNA recombinase